jgi:serine/threonine protein kinase/WD40 repeat protein
MTPTIESPDSSDVDPLDDLAEEFAQRLRRGERPTPQEYADRHPELADRILQLFPALVEMEEVGSVVGPPVGRQEPAHPDRIGEYLILRRVGAGGMGIVYEAVQESLGRHVALKVLPAGRGATYLDRFRREARTAARLHHTNIVPVFGVGEADGVHYYAMQFIRGHGLDLVLREVRALRGASPAAAAPTHSAAAGLGADSFAPGGEGAIPQSSGFSSRSSGAAYARAVARLGVQAADALAYAHAQGVLHRDVKPSNLLLDAAGVLWVTDFGLAKADDSDDLTHTGDLIGTVRYMAPERFRGECDARSDGYALGVTLYELLTLRPAFADTDRLRLIDRIARETPHPPRRHDPHIPRDLETVVLKAMAKEPKDRYATAGELADDLRRFLADRPIKARRSSAAEQLRRWARRNPAVATLAGVVFGLLVLIAAGSLVALSRVQRERDEATALLFEAELNQARATRTTRQPGQRHDSLAAAVRAARIRTDDRLRDEATAALALIDLQFGPPLPDLQGDASLAVLAPLDDVLALTDGPNRVRLVRLTDHQELWRVAVTEVDKLDFSPSGRHLAIFGGGRVVGVVRVADGEPVVDRRVPADAVAFSPDERRLAVARSNRVTTFDLADRKRQVPPWEALGTIHSLAYSSDGRRLAVGYKEARAATVHDAATGDPVGKSLATERPGQVVAWHPDGRRLGVGDEDGRAEVWDTESGQRLAALPSHAQTVTVVSFHPGGEMVATASWDGVLRVSHAGTGRPLLQLAESIHRPAFAGGSLGAVRRGGHIRRLEVTPTTEYRTLIGWHSAADGVAGEGTVSPDGRLLALGTGRGVRVWDLAAGREVAFVRGPTTGAHLLPTFEPPGGVELVAGGRAWPLAVDPLGDGKRLLLGPPRRLPFRRAPANGVASADGRFLAVTYEGTDLDVLDRATGRVTPLRGGHAAAGQLAITRDGTRVASSGWFTPEVKLWDAATGEPLRSLTVGGQTAVHFAPDGRSLLTSRGDGIDFRGLDDLKPARRVAPDVHLYPPPVAFTADGCLMATELAPGVVSLLDTETHRTVARLIDPNGDRARFLTFNPAGDQLVAVATYDRAVHVWDLRLIRERLAEIHLDWDWPKFDPAAPRPADRIEVRVADSWLKALTPPPK